MRNNRKTRPSPRGLLADQGSGKGDKPRHTLNAQWQENYDAIDWGRKKFYIQHSDGTLEQLHAKAMRIIRYYGKSMGAQL